MKNRNKNIFKTNTYFFKCNSLSNKYISYIIINFCDKIGIYKSNTLDAYFYNCNSFYFFQRTF